MVIITLTWRGVDAVDDVVWWLFDRIVSRLYDDDGYVLPLNSIIQASLTTPRRLLWDLPSGLEHTVDRALSFCRNVSSFCISYLTSV